MKLQHYDFFYKKNEPIYYVSESVAIVKSINKKAKFCSNLDLFLNLENNTHLNAGIFLDTNEGKAQRVFPLTSNIRELILKHKIKIIDLVHFLNYAYMVKDNEDLALDFDNQVSLEKSLFIFLKSFDDYKQEVISKDTTFNKQRRISKVKIERICENLRQKIEK